MTVVDRTSSSSHRSIVRYWPTIAICSYPHLRSKTQLEGSTSKYSNDVWKGKARMVRIPHGEKKWIYLFVLTESTNVTDGRHRPRLHSIARQKPKQVVIVAANLAPRSWLWTISYPRTSYRSSQKIFEKKNELYIKILKFYMTLFQHSLWTIHRHFRTTSGSDTCCLCHGSAASSNVTPEHLFWLLSMANFRQVRLNPTKVCLKNNSKTSIQKI